MSQRVDHLINRVAGSLGVRLVRNRDFRDPAALLARKAREAGVQTVLDIGANIGQFGHAFRALGWDRRIVSFEPLAQAHRELTSRAASDPQWTIAPPMALGSKTGETTINVSANLASSSLLAVDKRSVEAEPQSAQVKTETIRVSTLDAALQPEWQGPLAIKLDTQGFELEVLKGAQATLPDVAVIMTEMSLAPLYEGGAGFIELYQYLEAVGFRAIALTEGFSDFHRNEMLQVDGVFVRDR